MTFVTETCSGLVSGEASATPLFFYRQRRSALRQRGLVVDLHRSDVAGVAADPEEALERAAHGVLPAVERDVVVVHGRRVLGASLPRTGVDPGVGENPTVIAGGRVRGRSSSHRATDQRHQPESQCHHPHLELVHLHPLLDVVPVPSRPNG